MIENLLEIVLPFFMVYLVVLLKFKGKLLIDDISFLFETTIAYIATGAILGLYLNHLFGDLIDHQFNILSIISGVISVSLLLLAYKTSITKWLYLLDLGLWITVLSIKGGYNTGFFAGLPYLPIVLFDFFSTLMRLQLFRKLVFDFKWTGLICLSMALIIIKYLFFGYPLILKIIEYNYWR